MFVFNQFFSRLIDTFIAVHTATPLNLYASNVCVEYRTTALLCGKHTIKIKGDRHISIECNIEFTPYLISSNQIAGDNGRTSVTHRGLIPIAIFNVSRKLKGK